MGTNKKSHKKKVIDQPQDQFRQANAKCISTADATSTIVDDVSIPEYVQTICAVCGGGLDEEEVLICDGNCGNEIHMYCLRPQLTTVPKEDWLCPVCSINGNTDHLQSYLDNHISLKSQEAFQEPQDYHQWLLQRQWNWSLHCWPTAFPGRCCLISDEFDSSDIALIGCTVRVYCEYDSQYHSGRIISRRYDKKLRAWEHLVQFKSGADGRNKPLISWICLREHACAIGTEVVWTKNIYGFWWPGIIFLRSGMEILEFLRY